jgi:protein Mpv17
MMTTMATRAPSSVRLQVLHQIKSRSFSTPTRPSSSLLSGLWNAYSTSLEKRPLFTKAGIAAVIFFGSDSATQYLLRDKKETFQWDAPRAFSGATFGVVATAWLHYWWGFLEVAVGARFPVVAASQRSKLSNALVKVALDQAIGAPLYIYSYFVLTNFGQSIDRSMTSLALLESWKETNTRAADMLWPTMLKHWQLWPFVHCINFYFLPLHHRVLVQNTVLVGWSGFLSHLNNGGLVTPDEEGKVVIPPKVAIPRLGTKERLQQSLATAHVEK